MRFPSFRQAAWLAAGIAVAALAACNGDDDNAGPTVTALSSKPDYVSGGSVLIDVALVDTSTTAVTATLNGVDVASAFKVDPRNAGHLLGLVTGVKNGANTLVVSSGGGSTTYNMTGYPISGPIISGPQQSPFVCQTSTFALPDASLLGASLDADCTATPRVTYMYLATGATTLAPLPSTTALPGNVATTTTLGGATVPFVVRVETSTVNRGI